MIKTLRITTIIASILAVGLLAFPVVYGYRSAEQEQIVQFLNSPGVIETFNQAKGIKTVKKGDQIPPLVKEATKFGLYLNPPPEVKSALKLKPKPTKVARKEIIAPTPPKSTAKFTLIGTSYYQSHPELSLAYIDEPGKGLYWVRQGAEVGHLLIEEVKDGSVVVKDRQKSMTLVPNRPPKKSLLKGESTSKSIPVLPGSSASITSIVPTQASAKQAPEPAAEKPSADVTSSKARQPNFEEMAMMDKLIAEVSTSMRTDAETGSQQDAEKSKALLERFISDLETMRVSTEEAKRLDRMGKELNKVQSDPNRPRGSKIQKPRIPPPPRPPRPPR